MTARDMFALVRDLRAAGIEVVPSGRKFSHEVPAPHITWRTVEELLAEG